MKKLGLSGAILLTLFVTAGARAEDEQAVFRGFSSWVDTYIMAKASAKAGLEAEGQKLAKQRKPMMLGLMERDPEAALKWALPPDLRLLLPQSVSSSVESWWSDRISSSLFSAGPLPKNWKNYRELLVNGQVLRGFVYGRREKQYRLWDLPAYGIVMDGTAVVEESPVWILEEPADGKGAWIADIGGDKTTFKSWDALQKYEQALLACEQAEIDRDAAAAAKHPDSYSITINVPFEKKNFQIEKSGDYTLVSGKDQVFRARKAGDPLLPAKTIYVQLPSGAVATQVVAQSSHSVFLKDVQLPPVQSPQVNDKGELPRTEPNKDIYSQKTIWPADCYDQIRMHRIRGQSFVSIRLLPVRPIPGAKQVMLASKITLRIDCAWPKARPTMLADGIEDIGALLGDKLIDTKVPDPEPVACPLPVRLTRTVAGAQGGPCDYLIITAPEFRDLFDDFVRHRETFSGYRVCLKDTAEIVRDYGTWPDGTPCPDKTAVRNCIRDYVEHRGTRFVLLGGNAEMVPTYYMSHTEWDDWETFFGIPYWPGEETYPSDMPFSGLNEPFRSTVDTNMWYEAALFDPALPVGRLPFNDRARISHYLYNVIQYERFPPYELAGKFLLVGNRLHYGFCGPFRPTDEMHDGHRSFTSVLHLCISDAEIWLRRAFRDCVQQSTGWPKSRLKIFCDTLTSWDGEWPSGSHAQNQERVGEVLAEGWNCVLWDSHGGNSLESGESYAPPPRAGWGSLLALNGGCSTAAFDRDECNGALMMEMHKILNFVGFSGTSFSADNININLLGDDLPVTGFYVPLGGAGMRALRYMLETMFLYGWDNVGWGYAIARMKAADHIDRDAEFSTYEYTVEKMTLLGDPAIQMIGIKPQIELTCDRSVIQEGSQDGALVSMVRHSRVEDPLLVTFTIDGTCGWDEVQMVRQEHEGPPLVFGGESRAWFLPGQTNVPLVRLLARTDNTIERPRELVWVRLQENNAGYDVLVSRDVAQNADAISHGELSIGIEDRTPPYQLSVSVVNPVLTEDSGETAVFRIVRTGLGDLSDSLQFDFAVDFSGGNLEEDLDGARSQDLLAGYGVFRPGQRTVDIAVCPRRDFQRESDEVVYLGLLRSDEENPRYLLQAPWCGEVTIQDDDIDPQIAVLEPASGTRYQVGDPLHLEAVAQDADDGVAFVAFWIDDIFLGQVESSPYVLDTVVPYIGDAEQGMLRAYVWDRSGASAFTAAIPLQIAPIPPGPGNGIRWEVWYDLAGGQIEDLTGDARFPRLPDEAEVRLLAEGEGWEDLTDRYGSRLVGYFIAPKDGDYRFYLSADDLAELWLSPDLQRHHKQKIVDLNVATHPQSWNERREQVSAPVHLQRGRRYYLEARHVERAGDDYLGIGVELPGSQKEMPIPAHRLEPWVPATGIVVLGEHFVLEEDPASYLFQVPSYAVLLDQAPQDDLRVRIDYNHDQLIIEPEEFTFTRDNWMEDQVIHVRARNDRVREESPQTSWINHCVWDGDDNYLGNRGAFPVQIIDNDQPLLSVISPGGLLGL